jgi:hypothetical protein
MHDISEVIIFLVRDISTFTLATTLQQAVQAVNR